MKLNAFDTIVAPITGTPPAAVAWVRLSGPDSWSIASRVISPWRPEARLAQYGRYASGDDGLALPFLAEHSYTGEDAVELSMHGSRASIDAVVEACLSTGARLAEPGEFTLRAFLNGRLDLSQAEGVRESCEALTEAQLRAASRLREGAIRGEIDSIRATLLGLLAQVEASVDFSEEIGDFDRMNGTLRVDECLNAVDRLLSTASVGRVLQEGYRIAIVGPPNAGKSSLLNALLKTERSIVTDVPGTTRDYVEELADFGGVPVVLIDTAGLRETSDAVESIGVQRSRAQAAHADAIWYVHDAAVGWTAEDERQRSAFDRPLTVLANKSDLTTPAFGLAVSARTGFGIALLIERVAAEAKLDLREATINRRHEPILREARTTLEELGAAIQGDAPDDLLSVLLNQALGQLGEITGETASPDMIERIFADFCIGK